MIPKAHDWQEAKQVFFGCFVFVFVLPGKRRGFERQWEERTLILTITFWCFLEAVLQVLLGPIRDMSWPPLFLPLDGRHSTMMGLPEASQKERLCVVSQLQRRFPTTGGGRGFEKRMSKRHPLRTQTPGSWAVTFRCFHSQ